MDVVRLVEQGPRRPAHKSNNIPGRRVEGQKQRGRGSSSKHSKTMTILSAVPAAAQQRIHSRQRNIRGLGWLEMHVSGCLHGARRGGERGLVPTQNGFGQTPVFVRPGKLPNESGTRGCRLGAFALDEPCPGPDLY